MCWNVYEADVNTFYRCPHFCIRATSWPFLMRRARPVWVPVQQLTLYGKSRCVVRRKLLSLWSVHGVQMMERPWCVPLMVTLLCLAATVDISQGIGSCLLNKCLCMPTTVNCADYNVARPIFTTYERIYVKHMLVRWIHVPWIKALCHNFPALKNVFIGNQEAPRDADCPTLTSCPTVGVECRWVTV